jgi:Cytochrome c554 and c-prime
MVVRSRSFLLPPLIAFFFAGATCWRLIGAASEPIIAAPGVPSPPNAATMQFQLQGSGSCTASACHNADLLAGPGRHEYRLAMEPDPANPTRLKDRHAQAYAVLLEERSQKIAKKLHPGKHGVRAETDALCVKCHVHPAFHPDYEQAPVQRIEGVSTFRAEDGVSCEACHGAAKPWLSTHLSADWKEQLAHGHRDTRTLHGRIRLCAECHVGTHGMEVNHDLIAAGHPRLSFEFSGFHALLHKHWNHAKDTDPAVDPRGRPDFEARAWLLGQVVTAQVALELLADRADEMQGGSWPEFAEHDCAACHHSLDIEPKRAYPDRRPGVMPQNRWYLAMLPQSLAGLGVPADKKLLTTLDKIRKGLETLSPKRMPVAEKAREAAAMLGSRLAEAEAVNAPAANWLAEFTTAAQRGKDTVDDDVQYYLAHEAVSRARKDAKPVLDRHAMRLFLQIPSDNRFSTIDQVDFRKTLKALKGKVK